MCKLVKYSLLNSQKCSNFIIYITCIKKVAPLKVFEIFSLRLSFFGVKFCKCVGNSHPRIFTDFCRFILIFHQMALIIPRVPIVFTLSSCKYSPRKWKCSVPAFWKWRHFSLSRVLVSDNNCKQSLSVWYFTINVLLTLLLTRDIDIANLSVRPLRSGIVWYDLTYSHRLFWPYGSPIILVLLASNIFTKFRWGHPLRGQ